MEARQPDYHSDNDRRRFQRRALLDRRRQARAEKRRAGADRRAAVREAEDFWNKELFDEPQTIN